MNSKNNRPVQNSGAAIDPAAPRKRFRIAKLEERIAPKKGGKGTNNCGSSAGTSFSGGSIY